MIDAPSTDDIEVISREPRILNLRFAERLGVTDFHKIRTKIEQGRYELQRYGRISTTVEKDAGSPSRCQPRKEFRLNEPKTLLIRMPSRTEKAAKQEHHYVE